VGLVKEVAGTTNPLHITTSDIALTVGVGLTVMVKDEAVPVQLLAVGVTVMVAEMGAVPVLVAVNEEICPDRLTARPMAGFEFVQVKVAPGVGLVKAMAGTAALLHKVILEGTFTIGIGLIATV